MQNLKMKAFSLVSVFLVLVSLMPPMPALAQSQEMLDRLLNSQQPSSPSQGSESKANTSRSFRTNTADSTMMDPELPIRAGIAGPTYQVHILGEVTKPGTYRLPASTRLSEAVQFAGGLLPRGASRTVELRRKGAKSRQVDLLAFKTLGDLNNNPYLLDNDVVYIPLKGQVVQISGAIRRPDTYEMVKKTTLDQLITLAGGYSAGVSRSNPIKVIRFNDGKKELIDVAIDDNDTSHFYVQDSDVVVIPHQLTKNIDFDYDLAQLPGDTVLFYPAFEDRVFVLGAVRSPGPYSFSPHYSVREYLTQAGGLTKLAKSEKKIHIISSSGKKEKVTYDTVVDPGDTIVIPERYMKPESMVQLVLGITSATLGITATVLALTR